MKLYHGTAGSALGMIRKHGLQPRGGRKTRGGHWDAASPKSCPEAVYLTDAYPVYFAAAASASAARQKSVGLVAEIDTDLLDDDRFNADEDALEQIGRRKDDLPATYSRKQRVEHYRDLLPKQQWSYRDSLKALGTCCYLGTVTPESITRIAVIDFNKQPFLRHAALDAHIVIGNYRFCAHDYRRLTAWVFGDAEPEGSDLSAQLSLSRLKLDDGSIRQLSYEQEGREGISILTKPF